MPTKINSAPSLTPSAPSNLGATAAKQPQTSPLDQWFDDWLNSADASSASTAEKTRMKAAWAQLSATRKQEFKTAQLADVNWQMQVPSSGTKPDRRDHPGRGHGLAWRAIGPGGEVRRRPNRHFADGAH